MPKRTANARTRKKTQTASSNTPSDGNAQAQSERTTAALSPKAHGTALARGAATANSANVSSTVARSPNTPAQSKAGYQEEAPSSEAKNRDREARATPTSTQTPRTSDESDQSGTGPAFLEPGKTGKR